MVDKDVLFAKISSINKHLGRVKKLSALPLDRFLTSPDAQDIVLFNLHLAVQGCIDIAAHIVSEKGTNPIKTFQLLQQCAQETSAGLSRLLFFLQPA